MADLINIEVVYATDARQDVLKVRVPEGTNVQQAIAASGVLAKFPEIDLTTNKIGVFAKLVKLDAVLRDRDRIEVYRPLIADPKEVRKQRAAAGKVMKKGGGEAE
jgi:putative ubiquitin-RnfH superfamily antitoxin RatB of RatAB toxin-antitoxin module